MLAVLLKLVPFRDYAYAAVALAAVVWFLHHDHVERGIGAARVTAAVNVATAKANAAAQARIDKLNVAHASDIAQIEATYEKAIHDNSSAHAADLQRLRDSAAHNSDGEKVLGGSEAGSAAGQTGTSGSGGLGSVPSDLALTLVDALRADDAALDQCYADRDELVGK
jgi:hypothetical protein